MAHGSSIVSTGLTTRAGIQPLDLPKKAHAFLQERFPTARIKHVPVSILRQQVKVAIEQYLEPESVGLQKADRDRLVERILNESLLTCPLVELFRAEPVKEFLVVAANQVIALRGTNWLPTSIRFASPEQWREFVERIATTGEACVPGSKATGSFDVLLPNGFRAVGIVPPSAMELPPQVAFIRVDEASFAKPAPAPVTTPAPINPTNFDSGSSILSSAATTRAMPDQQPGTNGRIPIRPAAPNASPPLRDSFSLSSLPMDENERLKLIVSRRMVRACADAGVYDLKVIPSGELQKIIRAHVDEACKQDNSNLNEQARNILTLEIFTGLRT